LTAILEARAVTKRFGVDGPPAVDGLDLAVAPGAGVGIVGESGSGKSTLARMLAGVLPPTSGEIAVGGRPWTAVDRRDQLRRRVQMIFQDPYGALNPWLSARDAVAEVIRFWDRPTRAEARERASQLLADMGLTADAMGRRPRGLSGGQCQRVGIARALACAPDVLIADEPTSALDVSVQAQILNLLVALREERGLAIVLISHDLAVVRHLTEDAAVMYAGRIVERAPTHEMFRSPAHPYTRLLVGSIPGMSGGEARTAHDPGVADHPCRFAPRCPRRADDCIAVRSHDPHLPGGRWAECVHPHLPAAAPVQRTQTQHGGRT